MSRDHFWRSISRDNVEVSALSPDVDDDDDDDDCYYHYHSYYDLVIFMNDEIPTKIIKMIIILI